ncbi:hypothetical protein JZ751_022270 [Albula glossodonta]|uniref:Uncharacterized protein n=1 Tax=Albula glossodonta TaxID=121402 RepID=A0A8T2NHS6_9TELE|nr:hypothetical protein JZ751_022270 [Albula glossodonta]
MGEVQTDRGPASALESRPPSQHADCLLRINGSQQDVSQYMPTSQSGVNSLITPAPRDRWLVAAAPLIARRYRAAGALCRQPLKSPTA